nr:E3 ubiquitin-protein ligase UPL2-like [Tanacetum cinerariifolium]
VVSLEFSSPSRVFCYGIMHEFFDECHENEDVHVFLLQGRQAWFYKGFDQLVIGLAWTLSRFAISSWFVVPCSALVLLLKPFLDMGWLMDSYLIEGGGSPVSSSTSNGAFILTCYFYPTNRNGRQGQHGHRLRSNASNIPLVIRLMLMIQETHQQLMNPKGAALEFLSVDMYFEQNDGVVCDVEAVSQESRGSRATLRESLRSLDVEIRSVDGQDDGGERQGPIRINASLGYTSDEPRDGLAGSAPIDTAFFDALPEKLRAEVLSGRQGQMAQPPNIEPQNNDDIDPEFLAALPPAIRADVLAQQQAQGVHRSCELEGQHVEMDTVSINATFPYLRGCLDLIINNQIISCNKRVGTFEFQLRLQEFIELGSSANKLPAVKLVGDFVSSASKARPPPGVSAAKQIEFNDESVKTKFASFIMGQRRPRIVLFGMHGPFGNTNQVLLSG